uniref:PHD-type domain-containing protein n=1 Tax=Anopheles christyi TaxID=43041 RepID=A0A182K9R0_9DIPT
MLGSPVEVRYDDGDSVVLIQADTGGPARSSTGSSGTATQATSQSSGEGGIARAGQDSESGGVGGGPGSGESRRIIIHDRHRAAGGSITILTPNNNLKISINKKRRYPGRPHEFQNAKRVLTHDLRHKLGELDELLKACDSENDDEDVDHRDDGVVGAADANGNGKVSPKTVTPPPRKDACAMPAKQRHTSPVEERPANGMVEQTNQVSTTAGDTGLGGRARKVEEAEYQLKPGEDVLVRIAHNDQYYLGTVIELEPKQSCLVRFEDQTTLRVELSRITRMTTNGIRTVKDHSSQLHTTCRPDEHEEQEEDEEEQDEEEVEFVPTTNGHSESTSPPQTPPPAPPSRSIVIPDGFSPLTSTTQLPYNPHALHWDKYHRVNTEGHYCYCGADGEWSREMIQCQRCEQWFHGRCVRSLQFPIFLGDTSYLFICSICNHGHEFVRRFELPVLNLVHLALYNLIMRNGCRLYDLRLAIIPYIEDNQRTLQLPDSFKHCNCIVFQQFLKLSTNERIELVQVVLRNNGDRFLNGKEMSLSVHLWTLRKALPPTTESISIPIAPEETVTEHLLRKLPECLQVCRFLPRTNHEKNYFMDAVSRERMLGLSYAERPISVEDPRINFAELIVSPACFNAFNCAATNNTTSATTANAPQPLSNQTADATVPSTAVTSLSTTPDQFTTINGARLVGAQKRKQRGIRYINPPILLPMSDGLEMIFPLLANFDGPNNPFYGVEQSVVTFGRARGRKGPMKRRLFEGQRQGLPIKRQLAGDSM